MGFYKRPTIIVGFLLLGVGCYNLIINQIGKCFALKALIARLEFQLNRRFFRFFGAKIETPILKKRPIFSSPSPHDFCLKHEEK